jgi:hypothetical protein
VRPSITISNSILIDRQAWQEHILQTIVHTTVLLTRSGIICRRSVFTILYPDLDLDPDPK